MKLVSKLPSSTKPIFRSPTKTEKNKYEGSQYAIKISGGFHIDNPCAKSMYIHTIPNIAKYDMTDALQIAFSAKVLNSFLNNDQICISSQTLLQQLTPKNILSVGIFENLSSKYESFVNDSLGHVFSNTSLFSSKHPSVDNKYTFYDLLTSTTLINENALSGEIHILDVKRTLANLQQWNIFGNRNQSIPTNEFIRGDFFFMKDGFSITMKTDLNFQSMYISLMEGEMSNVNQDSICDWNESFTKTYTGNLLIYLIP